MGKKDLQNHHKMVVFDFQYALQQWESIGVFDVLIPFILIFTIIFAILQKTKILKGVKGVDAIVSMSIAFLAIINPAINGIMRSALEHTTIVIIVVISLMLLLGLIWGEQRPKAWNFIGGIIGFLFFIWILGRVADYYQMYYPGTMIFSSIWWTNNAPWIVPLIIIIIFAIIVISSGGEKDENKFEKIWKSLTEKEAW